MDNSNIGNKELWETIFTDLPEVLTIEEVAKFLRVSDADEEKLIVNNDIISLPNISSIRIFKGFCTFISNSTKTYRHGSSFKY